MRVETFHFAGEPSTHPDEDALAWHDNRFAVFDGVTLLHQKPYPDPSPAAQAAQAGCRAILDEPVDAHDPEATLRHMATAANRAIKRLNQSLDITEKTVDYLAVQYAAAVGAFGFIEGNTLHCAQLTDCEVMVVDAGGAIKFRLESPMGPIAKYLQHIRRREHFAAGSPEEHRFVRQHVINNPALEFEGRPIRVGVFTGQEVAEQFLNVGQCTLAPHDTILFFSDGMTPFLDEAPLRTYLAKVTDFKYFEHYHRGFSDQLAERSLIVVRPEL